MLRPALLVLSGLLCLSLVVQRSRAMQHCESCGAVCVNFCNTREFRPCCINFIRKRSSPPTGHLQLAAPVAAPSGLQQEQRPWRERSRSGPLPEYAALDPANLDQEAEI